MEMNIPETFGELLKTFRKRRKLTQKQLAEKIEVSLWAVSWWERGDYKPVTDGVLYDIAAVLRLTPFEQQQLFEAYTITALTTSFHNPPFGRNLYFTGRGAQLNQLHSLLTAGKQVALTQAISGLGGIGKTQLALEYAHRYQKSYHDIFWVNAETEDTWIDSYVRLAGLLRLPEYEEADQHKTREAFMHWLRRHSNWLLILDNVEDLPLLKRFVLQDGQGAILLTTRRRVTEPMAQALELEHLPENEALLFLLKRTKVLSLNQSMEEASEQDIEAARTITRLLGNLPLAIDQAAAYMLETPCSFSDYIALFQQYRGQLLQRRIGEHMPTDHPLSVTGTFILNFQQVGQRNPAAGELLRLFAFLAPDAIPEAIITEGESLLGPVLAPVAADRFQLNQAIEALYAYSLVQRDFKGKMLSIHRLVQAVIKDSMNQEAARAWAERTVKAVNAAFPDPEPDVWQKCESLLSHALLAARYVEDYRLFIDEAGSLAYKAAIYLQAHARYEEAESLYTQALRLREQQKGMEHPDVAATLNGLGSLCRDTSKYAAGEAYYLRALSIQERWLGKEHLDGAISLAGLANLYRDQSKYAEAEPLHLRALAIREKQLGHDHLLVATSLYLLASLYTDAGRYEESEPLLLRALAIREKAHGQNHPDIALTLNNLAIIYLQQGRYEEAELTFQRALAIREQVYGENHPETAYSLNNLAALYFWQQKYTDALPLLKRALRITEHLLGTTNSSVARLYSNLAEIYLVLKQYEEAEPLYRQALDTWKELQEPEHADVTFPLDGLATLYREQGKYAEAEALYHEAIRLSDRTQGHEHLDTAKMIYHLALLWEAQDNKEETKKWCMEALKIQEKVLGQYHPSTIETRSLLITVLHALEEHEEAARLEAVQNKPE